MFMEIYTMSDIIGFFIIILLFFILICQFKQAFYPIIYNSEDAGVEVEDAEGFNESNPLYNSLFESIKSVNTYAMPTEFLEKEIDNDTGVEVITDKQECQEWY